MTIRADAAPHLRLARRLAPAQALYIFGSSVDLTLTGIVGARLAPSTALATLPFSLIPVASVATTFLISRFIGRLGYRTVFTTVAVVALFLMFRGGKVTGKQLSWSSLLYLLFAGLLLLR